jgi:glycogen debranching enzyme
MALDLLDDFPLVARTTIEALTRYQGVRTRVRSEEEPGRILHEQRYTDSHRNPRWNYPYYGTVDASTFYVRLVNEYVRVHGPSILAAVVEDRLGRPTTVLTGVERAVGWIERRLERFGILYVQRAQPHGLSNQVWPDSYDAFHFEDGLLFDPDAPYAPVGVQGYAYDALLAGAAVTGDPEVATRWRERAARLRKDTLDRFWSPAIGGFALALTYGRQDGQPRPALVVASDGVHLLASHMLDGDDAQKYRQVLRAMVMADHLLAGAGVRLRSLGSPRFNPGAYHNGSVWPMDTGILADALLQHGYAAEAADLDDRVLRAVASVGYMAEFFRGDTDGGIRVNTRTIKLKVLGQERTIEQSPQRTQGWTTSRVWKILRRRGLAPL